MMDWFQRQHRAHAQTKALLKQVDALIARADTLIARLEELAEGAAGRERDLTDGLYGIFSYTGRGEGDA